MTQREVQTENPLSVLHGARIVRYVEEYGITLAWFGGHGVHGYDETGKECAFWNTGSFSQNSATEEQVNDSMDSHVESGDFPY